MFLLAERREALLALLEGKATLRVYRVASGCHATLAGRNAGDLASVLWFLESCEERGMACGRYLTAYDVEVSLPFGDYQEVLRGRDRWTMVVPHAPLLLSRKVGLRVGSGGDRGYSFPEEGDYRVLYASRCVDLEELPPELLFERLPFGERLARFATWVHERV